MLPTTGTNRTARRVIAATGLIGLGLTLPCITATTASAASISTWDKVAQCESSGNWSINTGNGFYGGLQFTSSTWAAYGGTQYAPQANQATKDQQISVAEKVLASQGPGAWPVCSIQAGLTAGGAPAAVNPGAGPASASTSASAAKSGAGTSAASSQSTATTHSSQWHSASQDAAPAATPAAPTAADSGYTVVAGDWLSKIAKNHNVQGGWEKLYELNKSTLTQGPDTIYPGQHLSFDSAATPTAAAPAAVQSSDHSGSWGSWGKSDNADSAAPAAAPSVKPLSAKVAPVASASTATTASSVQQTVSGSMAAAVSFAESQVGQAYIWGGTGNGGWDCSGLTQAAMAKAGVSIPRVAADQAAASTRVSMNNLQPGDLLFWSNNGSNSGVYHVAIYIGGGRYVEAANPHAGVKFETISNYTPSFAGRV